MPERSGALFDSLLHLMARLRGPGGCPWDREQTRESLKPFLVEEAYEVLDAMDSGDRQQLLEELGDLLFQVIFHARLAEERGEFQMPDVLRQLLDKMTRRHPHVFGDRRVGSAQEALSQWEAIKHAEGTADGQFRSVLEGVPKSLPALLRAHRLQMKAAGVGFDWERPDAAWAKVREEAAEVEAVLPGGDLARIREELGDLLFSLVNVARLLGIDAEDTLRASTEKFRRRFQSMEAEIAARAGSISDTPPEELDRLWERAKATREGGRA